MTSSDLQRYIEDQGIEASILALAQPTPTVVAAAEALGVETGRIIKSLLFMIKDEPLLVIASGESPIDRRKLASYLNVGRGRVKFASADKAFEVTGFVVGSMPPFGHRVKLRTVLDEAVAGLDAVYGGGGDINAMMRVSSSELMRVTGAEMVSVSEAG